MNSASAVPTIGESAPPDEADSNRRERILMAAYDEFSTHGFAGVRIDAIAKKSGCNRQLLYYYFGSKAGLYDAVLQRMVSNRSAVITEAASLDFDVAFPNVFDPSQPELKQWARLLGWEGLEFGADVGDRPISMEAERKQNMAMQTDIVRQWQAEGKIDPELDPGMLTLLLSFFVMAPEILPQLIRIVTGDEPHGPNYPARSQNFFQHLLRALRPRSD